MNILKKWADHQSSQSWSSSLRQKRVALLASLIEKVRQAEPGKVITILDVGGSDDFWLFHGRALLETENIEITIVNLYESVSPKTTQAHPKIKFDLADGRKLRYADNSYDLYFSNSTIEHVGVLYEQREFAREAVRVSKYYVLIQTPNRYFPLEPHFLTPGFQFLPKHLAAFILSRMGIGWWKRRPDYYIALAEIEQIRLLSCSELKWMFPQAEIEREKIMGLTKSFLVLGSKK